MSGNTVAPFTDPSGIARKYTSSDYGSEDVDLVAATKVKRLPRMIAWEGGILELDFADGTTVAYGAALAGCLIPMCPSAISTGETTATAVYVWW